MHERNERPVAERDVERRWQDPGSNALENSPRDEPPRARRLARVRSVALSVAAAVGIIAAVMLRPTEPRQSMEPAEAAWSLDLMSAGSRPVTALVFGEEAGVHLVTIPAADGSAEPRRLPTRLAAGDVYMVSLGWDDLSVASASPKGSAPMRFGAQGRFVKLFKDRRATGIKTWW